MERVSFSWEESRCNTSNSEEHCMSSTMVHNFSSQFQCLPLASFTSESGRSVSLQSDELSSLQQQTLDSSWLSNQVAEASWLHSESMFENSSMCPDHQGSMNDESALLQQQQQQQQQLQQQQQQPSSDGDKPTKQPNEDVTDPIHKSVDWPCTKSARSSSSAETVISQRHSTATELSKSNSSSTLQDSTMNVGQLASSKTSCAADGGKTTTAAAAATEHDLFLSRDSPRADEQLLKERVKSLSAELDDLKVRLYQAESLVRHFKRHIEANNNFNCDESGNTAGINPEVIIELAQEVSRLNDELNHQKALSASSTLVSTVNPQPFNQGCRVRQEVSRKRSGIPVRAVPKAIDRCNHGDSDSLQDTGGSRPVSLGAIGDVVGSTSAAVDATATAAAAESKRRRQQRSCSLGNVREPLQSYFGASHVQWSSSRMPLSLLPGLELKDLCVERDEPGSDLCCPSPKDAQLNRTLSKIAGPAVKTPKSVRRLKVVDAANQTPLSLINDSNRKAFVDLQDEVNRLKREIEQKELENSRLLELSRRDSVEFSFIAAHPQRLHENKQGERLKHDVTTANNSGSHDGSSALQIGTVTISVDFMKKLRETHRHDQSVLQRRLVDSHDTCHLLQTRLEELVGFLQEFLTEVPPVEGDEHDERWRSLLSTRLNETQSLLFDVTMNLLAEQDGTFVNVSSGLDLELSTFIDSETSLLAKDCNSNQRLDLPLIGSNLTPIHNHAKTRENSTLTDDQELSNNEQLALFQDELSRLKSTQTSLQDTIATLTQKLVICETELTAAHAESAESQRLVEVTKANLSEREAELDSLRHELIAAESSLNFLKSKLVETTDNLQRSLKKNDDLVKVQREMENALVEQEKSLTTYEGRIQQLSKEKFDELGRMKNSLASRTETISALERERDELHSRVVQLEFIAMQTRVELEAKLAELMLKSGVATNADSQVAELKAIIRQNRSTAELLCEDLQKMIEQMVKKNHVIHQLTKACRELRTRCADLERLLLHLADDQKLPSSIDHHVTNMAMAVESLARIQDSTDPTRFESGAESTRERITDDDGEFSDPAVTFTPPSADSPSTSSDERTKFGETLVCSRIMDAVQMSLQSDDELTAVRMLSLLKSQQLSVRQLSQTLCDCLNQQSAIESDYHGAIGRDGAIDHGANDIHQNNFVIYSKRKLDEFMKINETTQKQIEKFLVSLTEREKSSVVRSEHSREKVDKSVQCMKANESTSEIVLLQCAEDQMQTQANNLTACQGEGVESSVSSRTLQKIDKDASRLVPCIEENRQGDAGKSDDISSQTDRVMKVAIVTEISFEQLQTYVEQCFLIVNKLLKAVESFKPSAMLPDDEGSNVVSMLQLAQQLSVVHSKHRHIVNSLKVTSLPVDTSAVSVALNAENLHLKQKLESLKQRYIRAKQSMKSAQEQLELNNKHKQQKLMTTRGHLLTGRRNDEAIIEQINKTRQVLAKTTQNLEKYRAEQNVATEQAKAATFTIEPSS